MASKLAHQASGVAVAVAATIMARHMGGGWVQMMEACVAGFYGATAPDWMEISSAKQVGDKWVRTSVIKHRTITHWLPLWIIGLVWSWMHIHLDANYVAWTAFALGGLIHLLFDIPNPTGIPILNPFKPYRIRYNGKYGLWRSGEMEPVLIASSMMLAFYMFKMS